MSGKIYRILFVALLFAAAQVHAAPMDRARKHLLDSLELRLQEINNGNDSITTLYNVFDLSSSTQSKTAALHKLYLAAKKHGREKEQSEILIHLSRLYPHNDSVLILIEEEIKTLPESNMKSESMLYISMLKSANFIEAESPETRVRHLNDIVQRFTDNPPDDKFRQAELLFSLCIIMDKATHGELLQYYLKKLIALVDSLDLKTGTVRNLVYSKAAPIFTRNRMVDEAIVIDKKFLNILDSLEMSYRSAGRPFRKLNSTRYDVCRRLLINHTGLNSEEVELFHRVVRNLAAADPEVARRLRENALPEIFYHIDRGEYAIALPMLKRQLRNPDHDDLRPNLLRATVEAAGAVGDIATQLDAAMELNKAYESKLDDRTNTRLREMQILYDYNDLRKSISEQEMELKDQSLRSRMVLLIIIGVVCLLLVLLVVFGFRQYRKAKHLAAEHFKTTVMLRAERNDLKRVQAELIKARDKACEDDRQKTEFTNMLSHEVKAPLAAVQEYSRLIVDCISGEHKQYLDRFAFVIDQNVRTLNRLVSDVLDMSSLEYDNFSTSMTVESIDAICRVAIDSVFYRGKPSSENVRFIYNSTGQPDAMIVTDPVRVRQVLINLLENADKFTEKGTIKLDYKVDNESGCIQFFVSDTGIGLPDDCEKVIFERFRKLNAMSSGLGLGLYVARRIAILLKGDVSVDTDYHGGARFVFTIMKEDWTPEEK